MTQPRLLGGRYQLDGVIGRGGMAEVYRARDMRLDRVVAVKTLRSDLARDPTFQARFSREAQSAASLNHPSVIAVYDTGEDTMGDTPVPYIVMEYVEGQTLRDLLREHRRLIPERALEMTDGILRALDYSHRGGIIHRDIKPANVMLTRSHEVKVMDFGIARAMADSAATMTQTAQVIGTAQYLSPEQARGERVDARSDLYSTGCVLYELLTGRPPFTGDSPVAIAYQHVREEPIPPSQVDPEIPQWCDNIVLKAMAKDANHRYQSAAEFRADIQRAMQGMPVAATAASTMMMGSAPAAQGTRVMGPVPGGGAPPTRAQRPANTGYGLPPVQYDEPEKSGNGKKAAIWVAAIVLFIAAAAGIGYALSGNSGGGGDTAKVAVPELVDSSEAAARSAIEKAGLQVGEVKKEYSTDTKNGAVISSDPQGGAEVEKGTSVALVISKGKPPAEKVTIPDGLEGQSQATVIAQLEGLGLDTSRRTARSDEVQKGMVIRTNPSGGEQVAKGSTVVVYVSSGPTTVEVPDVTNSTPSAACNQLKAVGLKCARQFGPPEGDTQDGLVFRTNPPAGSRASAGQTVTIFIARTAQPTQPTPTQPTGPTFPTSTEP